VSLDPKTVVKKTAARAAAANGNLISGAGALVASAALWNPLPLLLWGVGAVGWVLYAATSEKYTRRVLDDERKAEELKADQEREALRAKIGGLLERRPFAGWLRAGLLPDYLRVFARLVAVRDRVAQLLAERHEDYLAGLGIQNQLTYLLTAYLQFVQARLTLLQTLLDFRPGGGDAAGAAAGSAGGNQIAGQAAGPRYGAAVAIPSGARRGTPAQRAAMATAPIPSRHGRSPMAPIVALDAIAAPGAPDVIGADDPLYAGGAGGGLPDLAALLADLDQRIAALRDLAAREPATAKTREWHAGLLQKQQELLRECGSRDQQLTAQLVAVPDAFDVIAGRISAAQFDAAELASYTGGVVEQLEDTEKFVRSMRPAMDEMVQNATAPVSLSNLGAPVGAAVPATGAGTVSGPHAVPAATAPDPVNPAARLPG
jgi:hypothetical protein